APSPPDLSPLSLHDALPIFRVIMPDFRGSGRTVHPGGPIPYNLLADDMVALIDALHLDQPLVCGYGDGGHVATVTGIRKPASVRSEEHTSELQSLTNLVCRL